jgi:hypothetical protein
MCTIRTMIWLMIAAGVAGCAGQAHRSRSSDTVLVCQDSTISMRFDRPSECTRVERGEFRDRLVGPPLR